MKSKFIIIFLLLIIVSNIAGCSSKTVNMPVNRPAKISLNGINKIAIGNISGNAGSETSEILSLKLIDSQRYDVVDKASMEKVFFDTKLSEEGIVDEKTAKKLQKFLGTAVILNGTMSYKSSIGKSTPSSYTDKNGIVYVNHVKTANGYLVGKIQIRESNKNTLIDEVNMSNNISSSTTAVNEWPEDPDVDELKTANINVLTNEFMKFIVPYTEYESVTFETDSKLPELEISVNHVLAGNWQEAIYNAIKATEKDPLSAKAWYNFGLFYKYSYMFDESENSFNEAYKIKNDKKYIVQVASLEKLKHEQIKLEQQKSHK